MSPYPLPPTPQSTPRNSSSSSGIATMANGPRFSANSNLMNYSIPKTAEQQPAKQVIQDDTESTKREIRRGNSSTRTRQLESQIEALTLQNVKLQRTNRLLKIDTDNLIKQKTQPLEQTIRELTFANVQLQRATRLLQQDLDEKTALMEQYKQEQITKMKSVGPEYEFLVQMVNLLHRQISGDPTCEETCCYTLEPVSQSNMVMTLPPENEQQEMEAQHICRPVIHSSISQGSYATELENKILRLEQVIEEMDAEKEQLIKQLQYKDNDIETLKRELRIKDDIVSQLESDFLHLEDQLEHMQKELDNARQSVAHEERVQDPKRQSQLLMATKRRSLAIKDANALELMLRGDLELSEKEQTEPQQQQQQSRDERQKEDEKREQEEHEEEDGMDDDESVETSKDTNMTTPPPRAFTPPSPPATPEKQTRRRVHSFLSCGVLPCAYPSQPKCMPPENTQRDPFAPFTLMTIFLGLAAQMGVTDDWTLPITLAVLVSGFLWSGAAKGVQFKLKLN